LAVLRSPAHHLKRIGLEAGRLSQWLYSALAEVGLPATMPIRKTRTNTAVATKTGHCHRYPLGIDAFDPVPYLLTNLYQFDILQFTAVAGIGATNAVH
jgi:hypothetical protein